MKILISKTRRSQTAEPIFGSEFRNGRSCDQVNAPIGQASQKISAPVSRWKCRRRKKRTICVSYCYHSNVINVYLIIVVRVKIRNRSRCAGSYRFDGHRIHTHIVYIIRFIRENQLSRLYGRFENRQNSTKAGEIFHRNVRIPSVA